MLWWSVGVIVMYVLKCYQRLQLHTLFSCIQKYNHEQDRALSRHSTINRHFSLQLLESSYEIHFSRISMNWRFDCFGSVVANEFVAFYQQFGDKSYTLQVTLESRAHWIRCVGWFPFLVVMSAYTSSICNVYSIDIYPYFRATLSRNKLQSKNI